MRYVRVGAPREFWLFPDSSCLVHRKKPSGVCCLWFEDGGSARIKIDLRTLGAASINTYMAMRIIDCARADQPPQGPSPDGPPLPWQEGSGTLTRPLAAGPIYKVSAPGK